MKKLVFLLLIVAIAIPAFATQRINYGNVSNPKRLDRLLRDIHGDERNIYTFANGLTIDNLTNGAMEWNEADEGLIFTFTSNTVTLSSDTSVTTFDFGSIIPTLPSVKLMESAGATFYTTLSAGNQSGNLVFTLPIDIGTNGYVLGTDGAGALSWIANAGSFSGGSVTGDIVMANGIYLQSSEVTAQASAIQVWDTTATASYTNVLSWLNGAVPAIALGSATSTLGIVSSGGLNVSTAGVVTGATGITNTGTLANTGALNNTGAITQTGGIVSFNNASNYAVNINTGSSSGATSIGGGSGTVAIDTTGWDITSGGLGSGFTGLTFLTGSAIRASATTAETLAIQAYDVDGTSYENSILLTNGDVPAIAIGVGTDTLAINTTTWDVTSAGVASGLTGLTVAGTTSINAATNAAVTIGGGTGAMNIATDNTAQTINIATGGGVKATTLGSTNTTSGTTVQSGTGDLSLTSTDAITMTSAGVFGIGANAVAQVITIGNETGASALNLKAGTGDIDIQGVAASTITIGDAAQTAAITIGASTATMTDLSLGTGVGAHTIHIGDGGTAAQVITIGSDSVASSLALKAGTGNFSVDGVAATTYTIGNAAQTGTMKFGESSAAMQLDLGTGNGAKTVNLGVGTGINAINFGTGGTGAKTIIIGDGASTGTTTVTAGSGGLSLPAAATTLGDAIGDITTFTGKIAGATPMSFDGATANAAYTILAVADVGSSITLTLPNSTGALIGSTLATNNVDAADSIWGGTNQLIFEGATGGADAFETVITPTDPTADRTITLPNKTGEVQLSSAASALTPGAAVTLTVGLSNLYTDTPNDNEDQQITFSGAGTAGDVITIVFTTAGTADEVITFHATLVSSAGTVTCGTTAARYMVITFISNGSHWYEVSRTTELT